MFLNSSLARAITHVLARVFLHVLARALLHVLAHRSQQFGLARVFLHMLARVFLHVLAHVFLHVLARVFLHVLARVLLHVHVQCADLAKCKIMQRVQLQDLLFDLPTQQRLTWLTTFTKVPLATLSSSSSDTLSTFMCNTTP